jgi:hypothetical protein
VSASSHTRRNIGPRRLPSAFLLLVACAARTSAQATIVPTAISQPLAALEPNTLSVVINSGGIQTLASLTDNAVNTFSTPVSITTSWNVNLLIGRVNLEAYFLTPAQALANGTSYIPSSLVKGRVTSGLPTTFTAFIQNGTGAVGSAGGSLRLFSALIFLFNRASSRTDNLDLQLDLTGAAPLPPGTYSGTISIRAVVQ